MAENEVVETPDVGVEPAPVDDVVEQPEQEQETRTFSQEEVNQIVSQRVNETSLQMQQTFQSQMSEYNRQMQARQAAIEAGVAQLTGQQTRSQLDPRAQQIQDLLAPVVEGAVAKLRAEMAPVLKAGAGSMVEDFWLDKPKVPDSVKQATRNLFRQNYEPGVSNPNELLQAAYSVACRDWSQQAFGGTGVPAVTNKQPAPRIPANTVASGELGRGRAPVALGGNERKLGWEAQLNTWAQQDKWPKDVEEEMNSRRRR